MKKLLLFLVLCSVGHAQLAPILAPVAAGALADILTKNKSTGVRAASVAGAVIVGEVAGKMMNEQKAREKFRAYQLGRYQEAWIRAEQDHYASTLDRRSGLPPAFDGYWAMYTGLKDQELQYEQRRAQLPPTQIPADKDGYLAFISGQIEADGTPVTAQTKAESTNLVEVPTTKAVMPARTVNGIAYRAQEREFPRLP